MTGHETMIDLTPESLVAENVRQGLTSKDDFDQEVIAYYRLFIRGKNHTIQCLRARVEDLTQTR